MKLAYLISTHQDPKHLARLIESLGEDADFYVHIDKKIDIALFELALRGKTNVLLTPNRVTVSWGGFGQVLALLSNLRAAFQEGVFYDRIINISGSDYPIWSNRRILDEFSRYPHKEYIGGFNITRTNTKIQSNKIRKYWFFDLRVGSTGATNFFCKIANRVSTCLPISKSLQVRIGDNKCDVYFGSLYWALTYGCAKHIYDTFMEERRMQAYFRHAFAPSELFAQTIVFNSVFGKRAMLYPGAEYPGIFKLAPLHHMDYSKEVRVFSESDYEELVQSEKMFFRKVSTEKSGVLLDKIDALRNVT